MDETDRPDDRRADGSWVLPNSESRRQRNHEAAQSGIQKRKKTRTYPRLSCKIEYFSRQITPADQSLPNSSRATNEVVTPNASCTRYRVDGRGGDFGRCRTEWDALNSTFVTVRCSSVSEKIDLTVNARIGLSFARASCGGRKTWSGVRGDRQSSQGAPERCKALYRAALPLGRSG